MLAPLLGALISGAFATWLSWRLVFFINLPLDLSAFIIIWKFFPANDEVQKDLNFDGIDFLSLVSISCL